MLFVRVLATRLAVVDRDAPHLAPKTRRESAGSSGLALAGMSPASLPLIVLQIARHRNGEANYPPSRPRTACPCEC